MKCGEIRETNGFLLFLMLSAIYFRVRELIIGILKWDYFAHILGANGGRNLRAILHNSYAISKNITFQTVIRKEASKSTIQNI